MSSRARGGLRSGSGRKLLSPRSRLVSKEKKKKTTARLRFALVRGVDYYDFYWLKKLLSFKIAHARYRDKGPLITSANVDLIGQQNVP